MDCTLDLMHKVHPLLLIPLIVTIYLNCLAPDMDVTGISLSWLRSRHSSHTHVVSHVMSHLLYLKTVESLATCSVITTF